MANLGALLVAAHLSLGTVRVRMHHFPRGPLPLGAAVVVVVVGLLEEDPRAGREVAVAGVAK